MAHDYKRHGTTTLFAVLKQSVTVFELNGHVHFHVCVLGGVFEKVPGGTDAQSSPTGVVFHPATGIDADAVAQVQATLRRRILGPTWLKLLSVDASQWGAIFFKTVWRLRLPTRRPER